MKNKNVALYGVLISLALILSFVEAKIPLNFAIPGIKMGLPNIVIVFALYALGAKAAITISIVRVLIIGILFGNGASFIYSIAGAILSLTMMIILKKMNILSTKGVSIVGGVAHNLGQILMAIILLESILISYYFPFLCLSGVVSGVIIGILADYVIKRIKL